MKNQQEKTLLSGDQKRELKKMAHHLKPVVTLGKKRVTEALIKELDAALLAHELIKVSVLADFKQHLEEDLAAIIEQTSSTYIDMIGNVIILYREREEKKQK